MKRHWPVHPILFAAYPVVSLLAANLGQVSDSMAVRALILCVATAAILTVVLRLVVGDWGKAGLITTGVVIVFFSYGHVYGLVKSWSVATVVLGRHRFLMVLALALLAAWCVWVLRRRTGEQGLSVFFNAAGLVVVAIPVVSILAYHLTPRSYEARSEPAGPASAEPGPAGGAAPQPDIYYIILDGYARHDVLMDNYACDNSAFLAALDDLGFTVAGESRSNYLMSVLSMASSLNLEYLDALAERMGPSSDDLRPLADMLAHSRLREFLQARGYRMVAFDSGWPLTQVEDADVYLSPDALSRSSTVLFGPPNEFELLLLRSTLLRSLLDKYQSQVRTVDSPLEAPFSRQRERLLFGLDELGDIPGWDGDYFVFAHLVIPHPPFVFGPNGEPILHDREYSFSDGSAFEGTRQEYIQGYCGQVAFISTQIQSLARRLIEHSDPPPVILLQADHGPRLNLDWHDADRTDLREAFSILNAYYVMGEAAPALYPSITPVNSFRLLLNQLFGEGYELLPDESYYTDSFRPYDFQNETERALGR